MYICIYDKRTKQIFSDKVSLKKMESSGLVHERAHAIFLILVRYAQVCIHASMYKSHMCMCMHACMSSICISTSSTYICVSSIGTCIHA